MRASPSIPLPFTFDSVTQVLAWGASPDGSHYSHKKIAEWCDAFWCEYLEVDAPAEIERLLPILTDVETQWDLYLANSYSLEELRVLSFENVRMPTDWFDDWLKQVSAAARDV